MRILLPAVAVLVPLAIAPHWLFYYDVTPKVALLAWGVALALLLGPSKSAWKALLDRPAGRWFCGLLAAQELSLIVSTVFSTAPILSVNGGTWRRFGLISQTAVLVFALISAAWLSEDRGRVTLLMRWVAVGGALAAVYGICQYFGFDPLLVRAGYVIGEGEWAIVRPPGTLGHAGYFATWLLYAVVAGVWLSQPWGWGPAVLASIAIVLSGTRSAMLGLVVGAALLATRLRWYAIVAVGLLVALYVSPAGQPLRARVKWSREDLRGGVRLPLWRESIRMGAARPLAGFGPETFAGEFPHYESEPLASGWPDFYHESPHNMFLDAWVAQGLPGVAILLGLSGLGLITAWRAREIVLGAGLIAVLVAQQFLAFTVSTALWFYLSLAVIVSLDSPRARAEPRMSWIAARVALAGVLMWFGVRLWMADWAMAQAQVNIDGGRLEAALAESERARWWAPSGWSTDLYWSRRQASFAQGSTKAIEKLRAADEAFQAALRATGGREEPQNAWYNLAAFYAARNDAGSAEKSLRAAVEHAPNWFKPHWMLAKLLEAGGRFREAGAEAERAVRLDGGRDVEVVETLARIRREERTVVP